MGRDLCNRIQYQTDLGTASEFMVLAGGQHHQVSMRVKRHSVLFLNPRVSTNAEEVDIYFFRPFI